ncbi:putative Zn -C6 fungal-type DNA-binding domain protein [Rosellinia necatrix]|uniref:Putative Zn-C6 fungal-type DNA-binding domain protein n=1 Tax=Rosellinia necatrix TaxID=77044 RepID=A0A1S8A971_ROSNE|nr:putative Zn -C6 fungal-type DNA-binding domain protein [Rosellinia necatrix]
MNTVACALLRPLHPDLVIDEANGTTAKTAILQNCALDTDLMERYFATWAAREFPTMAFIGPLNSGAALLPLLPEARAREMLPRICRLMHTIAAHMPIARYVMKGWEAALWARKLEIPGPALPYFQSLETDAEGRLKDLPTSLVVARIPITQDITSGEWDDGELAFLLQKWDAMGT